MDRRMFVGTMLAALSATASGDSIGAQGGGRGVRVQHGKDRFGQNERFAGGYKVNYKVSTEDSNGGLFLLEQTITRKGGPPRHVHHAQDEWFFVLEGEYVAEVGGERTILKPGDSLFGPRRVPHAWAYGGETPGRLMIGFSPAGTIEKFFDELASRKDFKRDPKLFLDHGMEIVGPPLEL